MMNEYRKIIEQLDSEIEIAVERGDSLTVELLSKRRREFTDRMIDWMCKKDNED